MQPGTTVLQIGAGSGYYTAVLAQLVGTAGRVCAFEIDAELASRAARNLAPWPWVEVRRRTGAAGTLPLADAIYVNAGIAEPSTAWLDALNPRGRLLFPLQAVGGFGGMLLVEKPGAASSVWPARFVCRAGFIACQAQQNERSALDLTAAFARGGWDRVATIRFEGTPDETCWFDGGGWWLSTAPE